MQAFAACVSHPGLEQNLVVVGAQPEPEQEIPSVLREPPAGARLVETGPVPEALLPALFTGADALLFPALYEGFGLPALEALACGCPVLGSTAASIPEVVGSAGVLVDPYNVEEIQAAILSLARDENLRKRLGRLGQERAQTFTWARTAAQTLDVFERIRA